MAGTVTKIHLCVHRPAEPDELGRATSLCQPQPMRAGEGPRQCFVAVRMQPVERLLAVAFWKAVPETDGTRTAEIQWSALPALGTEFSAFWEALIAHIATQETHVSQLLATLRQSPRIELLEVDFPALVADPLAWLPRLREFLGTSFTGSDESLAAVVRPELFRQRGKALLCI